MNLKAIDLSLRFRARPTEDQVTTGWGPVLVPLGGAGVIVSAILIVLGPSSWAIPIDTIQEVGSVVVTAIAFLIAARSSADRERRIMAQLAAAVGLGGAGVLAWNLEPDPVKGAGPLAEGLMVAAILLLAFTLARAFLADLDRSRSVPIVLDGLIVVGAVSCALAALWTWVVDPLGADPSLTLALGASITVTAGPMAGVVTLFDRRLKAGPWGPYAILMGLTIAGLSWIGWLMLVAEGPTSQVTPMDFVFSGGALLIARGALTWSSPPAPSERFDRFAGRLMEVLPVAAVVMSLVLDLTTPEQDGWDGVESATAWVIVFVVLRQVVLVRDERRARLAERHAGEMLAREIRHRTDVLGSLARLEAADSLEETARQICVEAISLEGIDQAAIVIFESGGTATLVAEAGVADTSRLSHPGISTGRTAYLAARAASGPWFESIDEAGDARMAALASRGVLGLAYGPIAPHGEVVGVIAMGSKPVESDLILAERLVTVGEFGVLAGALIGRGLDARARRRLLTAQIARVIEREAFRIVFQPIVELAGGRIVGYEALSRFDDGVRPDVRFAEANEIGLGLALECATLRAAVRDSVDLPSGAYLSLNASASLATAVDALENLLAGNDRELVLEITEHTAVEDYDTLRSGLRGLGGRVRIAVDDAGSGYAGLQHILEIEPDIVKLDIALVRSVDADPARRALIASMVSFASETGALLVAEGVETAGEADTLLGLGVGLGQGFLFGRPTAIDRAIVA